MNLPLQSMREPSNLHPCCAADGCPAGGRVNGEGGSACAVPPESSEVQQFVAHLCRVAGHDLVAVLFFGSRLLGASPDSHSAYDLFVVVEDYRSFYRALLARPGARRHRGAALLALLNRFLPPNLFVVHLPGGARASAKCCVISERDLEKALSVRPSDHFCRGRLTQRIAVVYARGPQEEQRVHRFLATARRASLGWVPLYVNAPFTVEDYCRRMLEVSYSREVRPEMEARFQEVLLAQRGYLHETYTGILEEGVAAGLLVRDGPGYRRSAPAGRWERRRCDFFFRRSQIRATLRWLKYVITFEDWPDYIARKVERRTGMQVELSDRERRFPVLFLWPKFFQFFRARRNAAFPHAKQAANRHEGEEDSS